MRRQTLFAFSFLVILCSCKKGSDSSGQPNTKPDTSYLRKTESAYSYDATGTVIEDSTSIKFTYDAQRRPLTYISATSTINQTDTVTNSYPANQKITNQVIYSGSILISQQKTIDYLGPSGRVDSTLSTGSGSSILNGVQQSPIPFSSIVYNHYDANGNDILDSSYDLLNSRKAGTFFQSTYSGNSLTSQKGFTGNGTPSSVAYWQDGNMVSDSVYINGVLNIALSFTFLPTLSGEFSTISGYRNLLGSITQVSLLVNETRVQTLNYTFDKSNRVSVVSFTNSAGKLYEKDVYTYY